jgi:hypothetical protein
MEGRAIPPPLPCVLIRSCEASRLQRQLLTRAYQQVCPEIRRPLAGTKTRAPTVDDNRRSSTAVHAAAGA